MGLRADTKNPEPFVVGKIHELNNAFYYSLMRFNESLYPHK